MSYVPKYLTKKLVGSRFKYTYSRTTGASVLERPNAKVLGVTRIDRTGHYRTPGQTLDTRFIKREGNQVTVGRTRQAPGYRRFSGIRSRTFKNVTQSSQTRAARLISGSGRSLEISAR